MTNSCFDDWGGTGGCLDHAPDHYPLIAPVRRRPGCSSSRAATLGGAMGCASGDAGPVIPPFWAAWLRRWRAGSVAGCRVMPCMSALRPGCAPRGAVYGVHRGDGLRWPAGMLHGGSPRPTSTSGVSVRRPGEAVPRFPGGACCGVVRSGPGFARAGVRPGPWPGRSGRAFGAGGLLVRCGSSPGAATLRPGGRSRRVSPATMGGPRLRAGPVDPLPGRTRWQGRTAGRDARCHPPASPACRGSAVPFPGRCR